MRVFLSFVILLGLYNYSNAQQQQFYSSNCTNGGTLIVFDVEVTTVPLYNPWGISCNGACDAEIQITVSGGGGGPYAFELYDGTTTISQAADVPGGGTVATFSGLCADNYNVTVIDSSQVIFGTIFEECTRGGINIQNPDLIYVNVLGFSNPTCPDSCDGQIFANIGGGTPPLTVQWFDVGNNLISTANSPSGVCTGPNYVVVSDNNGCSFDDTVVVEDPINIDFGMSIQDVTCDGLTNAQATSTPSGSNGGPFNFTWTDVGTSTGLGGASGLPSHSVGSLYELQEVLLEIEDANGCPFDTTIIIPDVLPMTLTEISSTDATCFNTCDGEIEISVAGGSGNYTQIEWFEGTIASPVGSFASGPSLIQSDLCPNTDYFVTVTDDAGCTKSFQLTPVSSPPALVFSETHVDVDCNGNDNGSIDITVTGGTPNYNFDWSLIVPGSGLSASAEDQSGLSGGTYQVIYTDALGCEDTAQIVIFEPQPIYTNGIVTDVSCFDLLDGSIDVSTTGGNGGYVWTWTSSPNGNIVDPTLEDQTGLDSAVYHLNIVDALNCTYDTSFTLNKPGELFFNASITPMDCFGDNDAVIDLNPSNGVPNYIIDWTNPVDPNGPTSQSGLSAGTYTVTLTDANGCDKDTSIVVTEPTIVDVAENSHSDITCFGFDDGTIDVTASGGTPPANLVWTGGTTAIPDNTTNPTNLGPGSYTGTYTDANGCSTSLTIDIIEPAPLSLTITGTDLTCNGVPNGTVSILPSGGNVTLDYTYDWDNDPRNDFDDAQNISALLAGTYCVNIKDDNGCTLASDSCYTIIEPDSIFFNGSTQTDITCFGDNDGSITLSVSGGTESGAYDYSWAPIPGCAADPGNVSSANGLCPGDYTITASDDNGCTNDTLISIIEPLELTISETHTDLLCADSNTGDITITVSGGTAPLNVTWTSNTTTTPSANDLAPTALEPGDYTATVTDGNNCTAFVDITIATPSPLTALITGTDLTCNGSLDGTLTLTPSGGTVAGNYVYSWTGPNGFTSINQNLSGLEAGTYCVNIQDDNGCLLTPDSCYTLIEPDSIFFNGSTFTDMDCFAADNGAISLNVSGGTESGTYDFTWSVPSCASDPGNVGNASGLCAGTYNIIATDDNGCTNDTSFVVTEPTELILATDSVLAGCGQCNGAVTVSPSGGTVSGSYGISWSGANTGFTGSNLTESSLCVDTYTVVVTDDNGCTATSNVEVQTVTPPTITIDSQTDLLCNSICNGAVQTTISTSNPPYGVLWTGITDPSYSSANEDIFSLCAGDYSITVTDANSCSAVQTVTISEPPALEISNATLSDVDCYNAGNGAITITPAGGTVASNYLFTWTGDNSFTSTNQDISGLLPGNYCVNIQDDNGCSLATDSCYVIAQPSGLAIENLSSTDSQCGVANGTASVTVSGGTVTTDYTYLWDDPSAQTTATATGLVNNTYTVVVTDDNGCTATGTVAVNPSNGPAVTIDDSTNVTCPGAANGSIQTTGSGGSGSLTYSWDTSPSTGVFATTPDVSGLSGGTYVVTVTDGALCNSQEVITIDEPSPINIATVVTDANCFGENGTIDVTVSGGTVTGAYGYDWDNNGTGSYTDTEDLTVPAGTYSLTVIDDNSCTASAGPYTISEPTELTLATSNTASACLNPTGTVTVVASDGTPGAAPNEYTYIWTDGIGNQVGNTATASNLYSGCYDVLVTENRPNGCTATTTECISDNPGPTLSETHIDATCNGAVDGSIDLTITSTVNPVTVVWTALGGSAINPTNTDEDINMLAADEYSVEATDANGCTAGLSIDILEPVAISADAVVSNPTCASSADGAIDITINDAVLPISIISWSGPNSFTSTSEDISGLEVGQYCLHAEDANGCSLDTCITLTAPTGLSITTDSVDTDCLLPTGQVSAVASGGVPGYTYNWYTDATLTTLLGSGATQSNLGMGMYYVEAADINGCTIIDSSEVIENNAPTITIDVTNDADCFGNSTGDIYISVSGGTPNYTFDWDNDGTGDNNDNEDLTGVAAGTYNVIVTDAAGCSSTDGATIGEPSAPLAISGVQTDLDCNGGSTGEVTITVTGGTVNYTYDWTESGNLISTATDATGTNTVTGLSALTYDVMVTDANGCTATDQYMLTEPTSISLTMGSAASSCGNNDGQVSVTASGGTDGITYTYSWIDFTSGLPVGSGNATETGVPAGTYEVTVTDLNGCTATDQVTISDIGGPTVTGIADSVNCYGDANGTIDITVSGNPNFNFDWTGPNSFTANTEDINALEAGNYSIAVTDANGCITNELYTVGGPIAPLSVVMDSTNLTCFENMTGMVDITVSGGTAPFSYSWSGPNGFTGTTEDINSLEAGNYSVDITDNNGCLLLNNSIEVAQPDSLEITFAYIDPSCGVADGTVTATVIGGTITTDYTYVWTDLGAASIMPDIDNDITNIYAGNYQLDITDDNGCTATDVATVSNDVAPSITVNYTDVTCNGDADGAIDITVNGTNTYTYDWDYNGTGTYTDPEDLTGLAPGIYNVEVLEDPTGCISTGTATIIEPDVLAVSGVSTDLACYGDGSGAIDITVTGGTTVYTYDWDNLAGSNDPEDQTGLASGNYQVTVTDANGCIAIDSYTLIEPAQIAITAVVTDNQCFGETNGSIDVTVSNGVAPYTYSWDLPSANEDLSNLAAGTYMLTVTDDNGCTEDSTFTITEPSAIVFAATVTDANCTLSDGAITTSVSGGTLTSPDYTYDWQFGGSSIATTADIINQPAGTYTFYVTDDNLCQADTTVFINNLNAPTITLDNTTDVTCFGSSDGSADVTVSGGTTPYSYLWNPNGISQQEDLSGAPADTYSLQVTDNSGCITTLAGIVIDTPDELTSTAVVTDATCGVCNGEATITGTGGTGVLSYIWSNGNTGTTGTSLCSGIYAVQITDANGCSVNEDVTINDIGGPTSENLTTTDATCAGLSDGTAFVEAVGGTAPYSYFWPHDGSTSDTQSALSAGTYNVEMVDDNGCIRVATLDILEPTAIDVTSSVTASTCGNSDGSITITTTGGVSPLSINWTNPAGQTTPGVTGLAAGIYSVDVSDANGCSVSKNITISDVNAPTVSLTGNDLACNGDASGSINSTVTGAVGAVSYQWYDATPTSLAGQTNPDIIAIQAGDYTLEVTDAGTGCIANATASVDQPDSLIISVPSTIGASCDISCDGEATAIVTGGTLGYTFLWSSGSTSATALNLCVGLNTIAITDKNGCVIQTSVMIDTNSTLDATITANDATCGVCNGDATVSPLGGSGSYSVLWSNGTTGLNAGNLCSGLYPFEVTDDNTGCSVQLEATINDIGGPTGETLSITDVTCNGGADGNASVTPIGGTAPYNYNWLGISNSTNTLSNVQAGSYTLQVTDDNGCKRNVPVDILEPDAMDIQYIATDGTCGAADGSISIIVTGSNAPFTYLWTAGPSAVGSVNNAETGLLPGIYTIDITDNSGCQESTDIPLGTTDGPDLTMSSTDETCYGLSDGTGTVVATGNSPFTYSWTSGGSLDVESGLSQGQYFVSVTDNNGCVSNESVQINAPDSLVLGLPTVLDASCEIACDGEATVILTGGTLGYTYSWDGGQSTQTASGLCVGVNNVTITDANGCQLQTSVDVNYTDLLSSTVAETDAACGLCDGEATVTGTGGSGNYTINWYDGTTGTTHTDLCAGIYPYTLLDNTSGCSTDLEATINNVDGPDNDVVVITNVTCAGGSDGGANVTVTGGTTPYTYLWVPTGQTTSTLTNVPAGTYNLEVSDSNDCKRVVPVTIIDSNTIEISYLSVGSNCGASDGSIDLTITGGATPYTISWSGPGAFTASSLSETGLAAGIYTISVSDNNGCSESIMIPLSTTNPPTATVNTTDVSCFGAIDGSATATGAGLNFEWQDGSTNATLSGVGAGEYFVIATDPGTGCSSVYSGTVEEPDSLSMGIQFALDPLCNGDCNGEISAIVDGGTIPYSYGWSSSANTSATETSLCDGTTTLTITDNNGCTTSQDITLTAPTAISITVDNVTDAQCVNSQDGAIDITATGGTGVLQYSWATIPASAYTSSSEDISGLDPTTYEVTVTDDNGCSVTQTADVDTITVVLANAGLDSAFCFNNCAVLTGSYSAPAVPTYEWNTVPVTSVVSTADTVEVCPTTVGIMQMTLTVSVLNCTHTDTVNVEMYPLPSVDAGVDILEVLGSTQTLGGNPTGPTGSSYFWTPNTYLVSENDTSASNPDFILTEEMDYVVFVTDTNGCMNSDTIHVRPIPYIVFPTGITPNSDGVNDDWQIDYIDQFPDCEVEVYNRWGEMLFYSKGYSERWDGTYNGKELPVGTYYYIIELNDPLFPDTYSGPITIMR